MSTLRTLRDEWPVVTWRAARHESVLIRHYGCTITLEPTCVGTLDVGACVLVVYVGQIEPGAWYAIARRPGRSSPCTAASSRAAVRRLRYELAAVMAEAAGSHLACAEAGDPTAWRVIAACAVIAQAVAP